jgi:phosphoserine phosphatase
MKADTIIWDFDGTLLPLAPYDSEQTLMMHRLRESDRPPMFFVRAAARLLIWADHRQMGRKTFKKFYIRLMKGTPAAVMDQVSRRLSDQIPLADRQAIRHLKSRNYRMIVLSCGTANLSRRTLQRAGLGDCFETIAGNRFQVANGVIDGMRLQVPNPADKVRWVNEMGIQPGNAIAVGDGYTDIPLLDWAKIPVLIDRNGEKLAKYKHKNYHFISSTSDIIKLL